MVGVSVVVVLVLVAAVAFAAVVVRHPLPQTSGTLQVEGLTGEVQVLRDERGVPQLYADDAEDLFRAQGFVAGDRGSPRRGRPQAVTASVRPHAGRRAAVPPSGGAYRHRP